MPRKVCREQTYAFINFNQYAFRGRDISSNIIYTVITATLFAINSTVCGLTTNLAYIEPFCGRADNLGWHSNCYLLTVPADSLDVYDGGAFLVIDSFVIRTSARLGHAKFSSQAALQRAFRAESAKFKRE